MQDKEISDTEFLNLGKTRAGVITIQDMMFQSKLLKPSQRVTCAKYWQKSGSDFSLPLWWEPWIVISHVSVCEHTLAVHGDGRTYSAPGLPGVRPSTALAQTAKQAVKSHVLPSQRTLRDPQTLAYTFIMFLGQIGLTKGVGHEKNTWNGSHY